MLWGRAGKKINPARAMGIAEETQLSWSAMKAGLPALANDGQIMALVIKSHYFQRVRISHLIV